MRLATRENQPRNWPDEKQLQLLDIVVINDGTPDNSAVLAKEYEKRYPDIVRVIDQENRGHGGAWNHGTERAVGKYLFYLDSDDWFETSELSKLIYIGRPGQSFDPKVRAVRAVDDVTKVLTFLLDWGRRNKP